MGFFDDGSIFADAFSNMFGTPANASPMVPGNYPTEGPPMPYASQPGESVEDIAHKYGLFPNELLSANGSMPSGPLAPGTTVQIPPGGTPVNTASFDDRFGASQGSNGPGSLPVQAGINDIPNASVGPGGLPASTPVDQVTGVPPAAQTLAGAVSPAPMVNGFPTPQGMDAPQSGTPAVPLPQARPPGAPQAFPGGNVSPPGGAPPAPPLPPPQNIPTSTGPTAASPPTPPAPGRRSFLDTVMNDPLWAKQTAGSLAEGLKAVGSNWNKPGLAAFAGTAGSAIEGANKATDSATEQQRKATDTAIQKGRLDETKRRNDQMYQVYEDRLKKAQAVGTVQSRAQAWENSDLGKLQKANTEILKENEGIRKSYQEDLRAAANNGQDGNAIRKQMQQDMDEARKRVYDQYGLSPDKIKNIQSLGTDKNPFKPTSADEFHALVKPGQYFINPSDGKLYQRKTAAPAPIDGGQYNPAPPNFLTPSSPYMTAAS